MNRGQSLVEVAITAPILLLMFLGVFEVGWAIRSQMILDTASREGARYASKPQTLAITGTQVIGSERVITHTINSIAGQLELSGPDTIIVSVARIDTGQPCDPALRADPIEVSPGNWDYWPNCDCGNLSATTAYTPYIVISPVAYPDWLHKWPVTSTRESRIDFADLMSYAEDNDKANCVAMKTGAAAQATQDIRVSVEIYHAHNQLLGAPLVSNYFTDPIPLYSAATFRIVESRE